MKPLCIISCPLDTFSGYGARSRDFVRSLIKEKDSEWDIKILPQRWGDCPWDFLDKNSHGVSPQRCGKILISHSESFSLIKVFTKSLERAP